MAASRRPSYLKRQKEQQRLARAARKREDRLARKNARGQGLDGLDDLIGRPEDVGLDRTDDGLPSATPEPEDPGTN